MGEYAKRKCDGAEVKIGTCECMYYCRYEQRNEIYYGYPMDNYLWRIPLPSEDGTLPGDFRFGALLQDGHVPYDLMIKTDKFNDEDIDEYVNHAGHISTYVKELGMMVHLPCYHGLKLPEFKDESVRCGYNGKRNPLYLCFLKNEDEELLVGTKCSACGKMWVYSFNEIEPCIVSIRMKLRLFEQCTKYWYEHHNTRCEYKVYEEIDGVELKMYSIDDEDYDISFGGKDVFTSTSIEETIDVFKKMLNS